jgi:hypothetical protein
LKKALSSDGIYFKRARPKVHETGLGPNQPPTTEHPAHRIGYVLKPFLPVHRIRDYVTGIEPSPGVVGLPDIEPLVGFPRFTNTYDRFLTGVLLRFSLYRDGNIET